MRLNCECARQESNLRPFAPEARDAASPGDTRRMNAAKRVHDSVTTGHLWAGPAAKRLPTRASRPAVELCDRAVAWRVAGRDRRVDEVARLRSKGLVVRSQGIGD